MIKLTRPFTPAMLFTLTACGAISGTPDQAPGKTTQNIAIEKDVASIEQSVRIAAANKRIDELQAEVEALRMNPQTIEIATLKQRLEAVESDVYARNDDRPDPAAPSLKKPMSAVGTANAATPARKTVPSAPTTKLASKAEADAFSKGDK